ncbi:hypothetical protein N473_17745 [Pseudoalteromonas luteoviolacea CPMOR-1]|uniref:Butirosin biosynthesis protein H N-terminal domain-containing protein n=1 Tax=Pseudoalteromonas luteoviolacea CPMOR-1 TaxID=1365248 RepID=A0A162AXF4_9GAMM|nr:BtrH N-terminal domain-containing protein [Pseudoalteromonas luteoviolacea]KZN63272.1 hypothetical protein N473_17745 [Pseudoalteromonas luteoviolacea CPMOR-1]
MPRSKCFSENYNFPLIEISDVSINCYTGSVKKAIEVHDYDLLEDDLWVLGNGFYFSSYDNEYGVPEFGFEMEDITQKFFKKLNIKYKYIDLNTEEIKSTLNHLMSNYKGIVQWTNSKHLSYSDLYYSSKGYLHAIFIEGQDSNNNYNIIDSLVISATPSACKTTMEPKRLEQAITDTIEGYAYYQNKCLVIVDAEGASNINKNLLLESIKESCLSITDNYKKDSSIKKYSNRITEYMRDLEDDEKANFLRRIVDNINTLYVVPNRKLLSRSLTRIMGDDYEQIKNEFDSVFFQWKAISNLCIKCSITLSEEDIDRISERFALAEKAEIDFWSALSKILGVKS